MAYTKQTWACGDEITAEKLNHMEDGIENAGGGASTLVLHETGVDENQCVIYDKTWQEVDNALRSGQRVMFTQEIIDGGTEFRVCEATTSLHRTQSVDWDEGWYIYFGYMDGYASCGTLSSTSADSPLKFCKVG